MGVEFSQSRFDMSRQVVMRIPVMFPNSGFQVAFTNDQDESKSDELRHLELRRGNLFDQGDVSEADIVICQVCCVVSCCVVFVLLFSPNLLQTNFYQSTYVQLISFLNRMKPGSRLLSCTFLSASACLIDSFCR